MKTTSEQGKLDDVTLLRYAHISRGRHSGGMEQYLGRLNRGLLERNRLTIVQTHLVNEPSCRPTVETISRGRIIWYPIRLLPVGRSPLTWRKRYRAVSQALRPEKGGSVLEILRRCALNSFGHLRYSRLVLSDSLVDDLAHFGVHLLSLHWLSYDLGSILSAAEVLGIPYIIVNHFDNKRLGECPARRWVRGARAVAGVSNCNVPTALRSRYVNMSDAIDVDFFNKTRARTVEMAGERRILLPARVVAGKGHRDLIEAAGILAKAGILVEVLFAGHVEDPIFVQDLRRCALAAGVADRIHFLGQLAPLELRDWYNACDIVALPSASEGLGRVLLEAQAMEKPVVAYDNSGIPEAMINGSSGILVPTGKVVGLANAFAELLTSPSRRSQMGQAGRAFVSDRFSLEKLISIHEAVYVRAITSTDGHGDNIL